MSGNKGMKWGKPKKPDMRGVNVRVTESQWESLKIMSFKNSWTISKCVAYCIKKVIGG